MKNYQQTPRQQRKLLECAKTVRANTRKYSFSLTPLNKQEYLGCKQITPGGYPFWY